MKNTVLNDDADIYQIREEETEKQKWTRMNRTQKIRYFFDYYLLKILIGAVLFGVSAFLIWSVVKPKTEKLIGIAVVDEQLNEEQRNDFIEELLQLLGTDQKDRIMLDDTIYTQEGGLDKLQIYLYNKQLDLVIAEQETFEKLAGYGYFQNIHEFLDDREILKWEKNCVYAAGYRENQGEIDWENPSGQGERAAYGLDISENSRFSGIKHYLRRPVLAVAANAPDSENTKKVICYIMG